MDFGTPHPLAGIFTANGKASATAARPRIGAARGQPLHDHYGDLMEFTSMGRGPPQREYVERSLGLYLSDTSGLATLQQGIDVDRTDKIDLTVYLLGRW